MSGPEGSSTKAFLLGAQDHLVVIGLMDISSRNRYVIPILFAAGVLSLIAAVLLLRQPNPANDLSSMPVATTHPTGSPNRQSPISQSPNLSVSESLLAPTAASKTVTIQDEDEEQTVISTAATVSEVLDEAAVILDEADVISPTADAPLTDGLRIEIERAIPVTIAVDGRQLNVLTVANRPLEALAAAGVGLVGFDYLRTAPESLQAGDTVEVVRVSERIILEEEIIPYETLYQADAEMELDTQAVTSIGTPGLLQRRIRIRIEDGQEVGREVESEWVAREPVNQVISYGTAINIRTLDTPEGPIEYWRVVRMHVVAYTPSSAGKKPGEPGYGITASGLPAGKGVVAVDPRVVPFRSRVYVPGYGIAVAGDTGGGVRGRMIDLGYPDNGYVHWSHAEDVYYLTPVPENITYILP